MATELDQPSCGREDPVPLLVVRTPRVCGNYRVARKSTSPLDGRSANHRIPSPTGRGRQANPTAARLKPVHHDLNGTPLRRGKAVSQHALDAILACHQLRAGDLRQGTQHPCIAMLESAAAVHQSRNASRPGQEISMGATEMPERKIAVQVAEAA